MKKLVIINGTMGVGKTTISKEVHKSLDKSVWLDGDWFWMMNPWVFSEENIRMVMDNITHLLRNYLTNSTFDYVILSWVLHNDGAGRRAGTTYHKLHDGTRRTAFSLKNVLCKIAIEVYYQDEIDVMKYSKLQGLK